GRTKVDVTMKATSTQLEQLVVTGFGTTQEKGSVTSAVSTISSDEIKNSPVTSANSLLQGRSSGVQVISNSGVAGGGLRVKIRGTSSITGGSEPLYIVDGVPLQGDQFGISTAGMTNSPLSYLDPS